MNDFMNSPTVKDVLGVLSHFWDPNNWFGILFYAIIFLIAAMIVSRFVLIAATRILEREENAMVDRTVVMFLMQFAQIAVYVIGLIIFFHVIPPLNRLGTALLTGVSVMSVVFGLAAQNTLSNLVAGVTLLLYRPFHIDDLVQVATPTGTESGIVERLTLGYTMLRTTDDRLVVVPNSLMASQVTLNLNRKALHNMLILPVGVADIGQAGAVRLGLIDIAGKEPGIHKIIKCHSQGFEDGGGVILSLRAWCENGVDIERIQESIMGKLHSRFSHHELFELVPAEALKKMA
jgi:small-conductance mechanosensitive channel